MKQKKAVIEIQFNWIFVLIVGALIVAFFVFVVQKQRTVAKSSLEADIRTKLQAIISIAEQSDSTVYQLTVPETNMKFDCEGFSIGNLDVIPLRGNFAPSPLKSSRNKLYIASEDFSMPYKTTNLVYITTPDVRYVFYDSDDADNADSKEYAKKLFFDPKNPSMPSNITKEFSKCDNLKDKNNYKVRFIFVKESPEDSCGANIKKGEVTAISIEPALGGISGYGKIKFYERKEDGFVEKGSSYYLGTSSIIAAIFSDSKETYECGLNDALERLKVINEIYLGKAKYLQETMQNTDCGNYYSNIEGIDKLVAMNTTLQIESLDENKVRAIYLNSVDIQNFNKLLSMKSCPLIY